jgi:hypothetical protein
MLDLVVSQFRATPAAVCRRGWDALRLCRPLFLMASILERRQLSWPRMMLDYGAMVLNKPEDLLAQIPEPVDDPLAVLA